MCVCVLIVIPVAPISITQSLLSREMRCQLREREKSEGGEGMKESGGELEMIRREAVKENREKKGQ